MISLVAITPAANLEAAEVFANGPALSEFTVPLGEPATHYYLHAWVTSEEAALWQTDTPPWLIISLQEGADPLAHFNAVLSANGLQLPQPSL